MTAQQLKNSILQMAVQGKLVPQDPNDEPASVLLERIHAKKEQLIKEKKIKREKTPSVIFRGADNLPYEKVGKNEPICIAEGVPFEIPENWEWVRLGSIGDWGSGATPSRSIPEYYGGDIPWLKTGDLNDGYIEYIPENISNFALEKTSVRLNPTGSVLIAMYGATIGKVGILTFPATTNQACCACSPIEIYNEYLFYFLMSQKVEFVKQGEGGAQPNISKEKIVATLMPLPPLSEQYRIVAKIKELLPYVEQYGGAHSAVTSLNTDFPDLLKKSMLQEAVQGKLVPQDPSDESASVLLEHIRAEKELLIKAGKIKRNKHESIIFRRDNSHYEKRGSEEVCIDDEIPFEIPENWCWTRLGTMIGVQRGASPRPKGSPEYWSSERTSHHWIKISDITKYTQNGALYDTDEFLTDLGTRKSVFVDSDYLITAASGSLGKIAKLNISGYIYDGLMCMCFKNTSLEMDYIIILIQAMVEYLMSLSTGTAWKNITTDILKNLLVPLPPLLEQRRIIEKQQELFDKIMLIQ